MTGKRTLATDGSWPTCAPSVRGYAENESSTVACRYAAGVAVDSTGAAVARFDAADCLAAAFLGAGFFFAATGAACALDGFLAGATAFFTAGFAVFLAILTAFATLAEAFFAAGAFAADSATALSPTTKASRFFAPAIQPGARPNPDQVFPVFGSAYFATDADFVFVFFGSRLPPTA